MGQGTPGAAHPVTQWERCRVSGGETLIGTDLAIFCQSQLEGRLAPNLEFFIHKRELTLSDLWAGPEVLHVNEDESIWGDC